MDLTEKVRRAIEKQLEEVSLSVCDVVYEKEGNTNFLRITIDKVGGVDIDACVLATNIINPILDEHDFIKESYILDVSSKESGDNNE